MSQPALCQIVGRVANSDGAPIPDASIIVWEGGLRRGSAQSHDDGRFIVRATDGRPLVPTNDWTLSVRRIGYRPETIRLERAGDSVTVVMTRVPVELPPVLARVEARCPQQDDPGARGVWKAVASHYAQNTRSLPLWWEGDEALDQVSPQQVGSPAGEDVARTIHYQIPGYTRRLLGGDVPPVYAVSLNPDKQQAFTSSGRYRYWRYAELEGMDASHFVEESFERQHSFTVTRQGGAGAVLTFCTPDSVPNSVPRIEGTLTVDADSMLVGATWRFITPKPHEQAGGEVVLGVAELSHAPRLVALQGLFWRRLEGRKEYVQRWLSVREWGVKSQASSP